MGRMRTCLSSLLLLAVLAMQGCTVSRAQIRRADAVVAASTDQTVSCHRRDHCATPSPLLQAADRALGESTADQARARGHPAGPEQAGAGRADESDPRGAPLDRRADLHLGTGRCRPADAQRAGPRGTARRARAHPGRPAVLFQQPGPARSTVARQSQPAGTAVQPHLSQSRNPAGGICCRHRVLLLPLQPAHAQQDPAGGQRHRHHRRAQLSRTAISTGTTTSITSIAT